MALFFSLILVVLGGAFAAWQRSIRHARAGDFARADWWVRCCACAAGACAMLATTLTVGWPWKEGTVSVPQEVTRTVLEPVETVVQIPRKLFGVRVWTSEERRSVQQPKQVTDTVYHSASTREFSVWLLFPMVVIGFACYRVQFPLVRLLWRWLP